MEIDPVKARDYLEKALSLAKTNTDKQTIRVKLDKLTGGR